LFSCLQKNSNRSSTDLTVSQKNSLPDGRRRTVMKSTNGLTRGVVRSAVGAAVIVFLLSMLWLSRVKADAGAFSPVPAPPRIPAGTEIPVVIKHKIASSAAGGEAITGFVAKAVVLDGRPAIPRGAYLRGNVNAAAQRGANVETQIDFRILFMDSQAVTIETREAAALIPAESETETLREAFKTLFAATLGASIGAASRNPRALKLGLLSALKATAPAGISVPVSVILTSDLQL
jgi:hypothetical protein